MKNLLYLLVFAVLGCTDDQPSQESDQANLDRLWSEIHAMAESVTCTSAEEWDFSAVGSKACGGPVKFLAYSETIDTVKFLSLVSEHRDAQEAFNIKWGIFSDCSTPQEPSGVACEEGEPVLQYGQ
ncbi:hypothetical protein [Marinoscillum sp. 108]|uniref:hypothetical protein n=1 Tax=Marinoscillum sp. 108 TaxID=2653151 RepID=UPI0012F3149F|nr:hypothetical protein [Marinoscillum sp. 108]VXD11476.1 conserved hypothetical protein [Marinoscillum sp. 108]